MKLPFAEIALPPIKTFAEVYPDGIVPDTLEKEIALVCPHIELIRKFESSWDDITLSRFKENGLSEEIQWAWWKIVTTNRKILKTI